MVKPTLQNQTTQSGSIIPEEVVWYYVFTWGDMETIPRYQRVIMWIVDLFTKKTLPIKPTHVFAFTQVGPGLQFIEPVRDQLIISCKFDSTGGVFWAEDAIAILEKKDCMVIPSRHKPQVRHWRHCLSWMPTCVSAVKICTNLPSLAITPNSLYNQLMKRYNNTRKDN